MMFCATYLADSGTWARGNDDGDVLVCQNKYVLLEFSRLACREKTKSSLLGVPQYCFPVV